MATPANPPPTPEQAAAQFDEAIAVRVAGMTHQRQGEYRQALACFTAARDIFVNLDFQTQVAWTDQNQGQVLELLGRLDEALACFTAAERVFRATDERMGWPLMHRRRGDLLRRQGRHDEALAEYAAALAQYRLDGEPSGIINTLGSRAESGLARQDLVGAYADLQEALTRLRSVPRRASEFDFLLFARLARAEAARDERYRARDHALQANALAHDLRLEQDRSNPDVAENLRCLTGLT